jgi:hypothetical protein
VLDPSQIETRYAKSGELNIAYQVFGVGAVNLVFIPGWASNVENIWTLSEFAAFASGLQFEDLGPRTLKGVADQWRLFSVARA